MKKYTLLILSLIVLISGIFAQSFTLSDASSNPVPNGSVVQMTAPPGTDLMEFHVYIKNNSAELKKLKVKKTEIELVDLSMNTFCWANTCYPPNIFISPDLLTLNPGQTSGHNDFYGDYIPGPNQGLSRIMYTFFDERNELDSVSVIVHYLVGNTGIQHLIAQLTNAIGAPYPNPASQTATFDVDLPSQVTSSRIAIRNLLGAMVLEKEVTTHKGKVEVPVNALKEGVYFYTLMINGDNPVKTGKLIIKR